MTVPQPRFELGFSAPEADALSIALLGPVTEQNFTTLPARLANRQVDPLNA